MGLYDVLNTLHGSWLDHWLWNACPVVANRAMEAAQQALEDYAWHYTDDGLPTETGWYLVGRMESVVDYALGIVYWDPKWSWRRHDYAWRKAGIEPPEPRGT